MLLEQHYWYVKHCVCINKLHKLSCTAIMYFDFYISVYVQVTKCDYVITLLKIQNYARVFHYVNNVDRKNVPVHSNSTLQLAGVAIFTP